MEIGKWIESIEEHFNKTLVEFSTECDTDNGYPTQLVRYILKDPKYIELIGGLTQNDTFKLYNDLIFEISKSFPSLASVLLTNSVNGVLPLQLFGTDSQKSHYLERAINGELMGCVAHSEDYGSDFDFIETTAHQVDGGWELNGVKPTVSNAEVGNFFWVTAKVKDKDQYGIFLVERNGVGLTIDPPIDKTGMKALHVNQVNLNQVVVSEDCLLGEELNAKAQYVPIVQHLKITVVSLALGLIHQVLEVGKQNLSLDRNIGRRLIETTEVRTLVAKLEVEYQMLKNFQQMILDGGITEYNCAIAKLKAANLASKAADEIIQISGGYGFMKNNRINYLYRDSQAIKLYGGSTTSQNEIIEKNW